MSNFKDLKSVDDLDSQSASDYSDDFDEAKKPVQKEETYDDDFLTQQTDEEPIVSDKKIMVTNPSKVSIEVGADKVLLSERIEMVERSRAVKTDVIESEIDTLNQYNEVNSIPSGRGPGSGVEQVMSDHITS